VEVRGGRATSTPARSRSDFTLESGMRVKVDDAGSYQIDYRSEDGNCEFDLRFSPVMTSWDVHDAAR
jgi:hypothetical protein